MAIKYRNKEGQLSNTLVLSPQNLTVNTITATGYPSLAYIDLLGATGLNFTDDIVITFFYDGAWYTNTLSVADSPIAIDTEQSLIVYLEPDNITLSAGVYATLATGEYCVVDNANITQTTNSLQVVLFHITDTILSIPLLNKKNVLSLTTTFNFEDVSGIMAYGNTAIGGFNFGDLWSGGGLPPTFNTAFGVAALEDLDTGNNNTAVGADAGGDITTGDNNLCLGNYAGKATSPFNITTEDNRIVLGNNDITNAYIKVAWTVTSDARDKADVEDLTLGLNYIEQLRPITFKWDDRSKYWEKKETTKNGKRDMKVTKKNKDGSKKETKINIGLLAQEVLTVEDSFNLENNLVVDAENEENLKIKETALIPILIKAVQELSARVKELEGNK